MSKNIYDLKKKSSIFQFQVGYMKYPILKNIGHIYNRLLVCSILHLNKNK